MHRFLACLFFSLGLWSLSLDATAQRRQTLDPTYSGSVLVGHEASRGSRAWLRTGVLVSDNPGLNSLKPGLQQVSARIGYEVPLSPAWSLGLQLDNTFWQDNRRLSPGAFVAHGGQIRKVRFFQRLALDRNVYNKDKTLNYTEARGLFDAAVPFHIGKAPLLLGGSAELIKRWESDATFDAGVFINATRLRADLSWEPNVHWAVTAFAVRQVFYYNTAILKTNLLYPIYGLEVFYRIKNNPTNPQWRWVHY